MNKPKTTKTEKPINFEDLLNEFHASLEDGDPERVLRDYIKEYPEYEAGLYEAAAFHKTSSEIPKQEYTKEEEASLNSKAKRIVGAMLETGKPIETPVTAEMGMGVAEIVDDTGMSIAVILQGRSLKADMEEAEFIATAINEHGKDLRDEALDFFGIEILEDGSFRFQPSRLARWRKKQLNTELDDRIDELEKQNQMLVDGLSPFADPYNYGRDGYYKPRNGLHHAQETLNRAKEVGGG